MKRIFLLLIMLLGIGVSATFAQSRMVTGRVLDDKGEPITSAGVTVKGTTTGTVTDFDGNFSLNVPDGSNTLVIQALGMQVREVPATSGQVIRLASASTQLQGTIVTALAIKREKRELGYSATTIGNDELNSGNNVSALSAIQGKTAGANITSSTGGPGGSTRVVLRGEKSIGGNNNALIVVDGIPINNNNRLQGRSGLSEIDFGNRGNDVNPEDIESITVLKGPAAAALYGAAGANGAIMITTKSGKASGTGRKKTEITYQSSYTLQRILKYPEVQNSYGQGNIYDGISNDRRENFSWGDKFDGKVRPWGQVIDGQQRVKPYSAVEDNLRSFYGTGRTWENNASIGGASDNSSFYLSLNALNNKGVTPNTFYDKYSVRLNATTNLTNKFYTSVNINYLNINQRVEQQGQRFGAVWESVLQTPRDIPISETKDISNPFNGYGFKDANGVERFGYYNLYSLNPFWVAENYDNRNRTDRVLGNFIVGFKPSSNFEIFDRVGGDIAADRTLNKIPKYSFEPFDPFYGGITSTSSLGGLYEANINTMSIYNDLIAQYKKQLSEDVGMDVLIGNNVTSNRITTSTANIDPENNGLVIPGFYSFTNANGPVQVNNPEDNPTPLVESFNVGLYGSLNLNYKRTVFLQITARNDWTSTLTPGNRSFFYPSASLSYVFTESIKNDDFKKFLSYGKLRAAYASVGNYAVAYQNNNPAYSKGTFGTGFGTIETPFGGTPVYSFGNTIGNDELRPERTNSYEAGVELSFFKDRLTIDANYYQNKSIDQILTRPTPPGSGFTGQVINLGDISNKGVELVVRATPVRTQSGFRWELFGTYYKNQSMVERLADGVSQVSFPGGTTNVSVTATVGKPYGAFYALDVARDPQGRVIVDSASGLPQQGADRVYRGTYQPKFVASWGTTLRYKAFSLNVLFDTKQGGVFYSSTKDLMDFTGTAKETENRDPAVFPNSVYQNSAGQYIPNTTEYEPYYYYTNGIPDGQHIVDASYVKLREASLSFNLPGSALKKTPFGAASLSLFGNNLFIWTSKENKYVDPEVNSSGSSNLQGYDFRARSSLRNYGLTLKVSF